MRIFIFTLILYFPILITCNVFADNTTIVANYPAVNGTYSKVILQNLTSIPGSTPDCSLKNSTTGAYINAGLLFMYTDLSGNQTLGLCSTTGKTTPVPFPETCFNRFCSCPGSGCSNGSCHFTCPTGYSLPSYGVDSFSTDTNITVFSTVCCTTGSTVQP